MDLDGQGNESQCNNHCKSNGFRGGYCNAAAPPGSDVIVIKLILSLYEKY